MTGPATSPSEVPLSCCPRRGWARWLFALLTAAQERHSHRIYGERKRRLLGDLTGEVLELGPGTGANLPYLPAGVHWIGVEPNVHMHGYLRKRAAQLGLQAGLRTGTAETLDLPDGSVDAVVGTLVLCSVDDVSAVLEQVHRVLKPGGRFVFLEHVAAPRGTFLRRLQELITPVWSRCADGCHPNRETWVALEAAGFAKLDYERFEASAPLPFIKPHIAGTATR